MTLEQLIASGLTEEQAKKVLELHKQSVTGQYVPKTRFDEVNGKVTTLEGQVKERDTTIASLKTFEGTATELQGKVAEYETKLKEADTAKEKALADERMTFAMKAKLADIAHDPDVVLGWLDREKISFQKDGSLKGFDEQLEPLKGTKAYAFKPAEGGKEKESPYFGNLSSGIKVVGRTPEDGDSSPKPGEENEAEKRGREMAERRMASQKQVASSSDYYFGTGGSK